MTAHIPENEVAALPGNDQPRDWIPFSVRMKVAHAISDPAMIIGRRYVATDGSMETMSHWQARAAIEAFVVAQREREERRSKGPAA